MVVADEVLAVSVGGGGGGGGPAEGVLMPGGGGGGGGGGGPDGEDMIIESAQRLSCYQVRLSPMLIWTGYSRGVFQNGGY